MASIITIIALSLILIVVILMWTKDHNNWRKAYNIMSTKYYDAEHELYAIKHKRREYSKKAYWKKKRLAMINQYNEI